MNTTTKPTFDEVTWGARAFEVFDLTRDQARDLYQNVFLPEDTWWEAQPEFEGWFRDCLSIGYRFHDFLEYYMEQWRP